MLHAALQHRSQGRCGVIATSLLSVCLVAPLGAQIIADGARVRITPRSRIESAYKGTFMKATADSIWFLPKRSAAAYAFPMNNVASIEQSTHYKQRLWRAAVGAGVGLVVGAGAGKLYLASSGNACQCIADDIGLAIGALLVAAPIGLAVGASRGGEQWTRVPLPLAVSMTSSARVQVRVVSVRFR